MDNSNRCICSEALWKEVDEEKERLFSLMEQVHKKLASQRGSEVSMDDAIDLRKSNWRQVMSEVQKTARRWKNRPDKQSKVTSFIDKVGKNTPSLETWFGLLPAGDYGSRYRPTQANDLNHNAHQ